MAKNPCIETHAPHLAKRFDELVTSGISPKDAIIKVAIEDFEKLHKDLEGLKKKVDYKYVPKKYVTQNNDDATISANTDTTKAQTAPPIIPPAPPSGSVPTTSPTTPPSNDPTAAAEKSAKMAKDAEDAILKAGKKNIWAIFKRLALNRKTDIENVLNKTAKGVFANAAVENVSGSRAYADELFEGARDRIYARRLVKINKKIGSISLKINKAITNIDAKSRQALDEIIFHKRVISIDSNRDKKNKRIAAEIDTLKTQWKAEKDSKKKAELLKDIDKLRKQREDRPKHTRGFNKESSESAINGIEERLGKESFDDIMKRSEAYFEVRKEILIKMQEAGLISDATTDNLMDADYVERRFLEHILADNETYGQPSSLSSAQIKSLGDGSQGLVLMDSEVLLHAAYRSIENRIAQNRANKALYGAVIEEGFDQDVVVEAKFAKLKNGSYKLDKYGQRVLLDTPNGMKLIPFYNNGEKSGVFMRVKEAEQWNDSVKIQIIIGDVNIGAIGKIITGTSALKFFATLANPLFAIGNMARDFAKVLFLSTTYDKNILTAAPRLIANFTSKASQYTILKTTGVATDSFRQLVDDYTKYGGKFEFLHRDGKTDNLHKTMLKRKRNIIQNVGGAAYNLFENGMGFPGEISEISMRLVVFEKNRDTLIEEAGGESKISKEEMADINLVSANASRAIMDYNKGGLLTKWLDNFSPYLNASVVGFVSDVDYIKKNPKQWAAKMGMFGLHIAGLTLYNLMSSSQEERDNIPQYIKGNNFIIFIPGLNKNNKKEYRLIPKYQGLQPFAAIFEELTEAAYRMYNGEPQKDVGIPLGRLSETIATWSPIPMTPRATMLKMPPIVQAAYAYHTNYDLFRNSKIDYRFEKVPAKDEGLDNDKTARVFRVLGQMSSKLGKDFEISPSRAQNFTEKIITSPTTNFIVGDIYGIAEWATREHLIPREIKEAKKNTKTASIKNKFVREVDMEYLSKFKTKENSIEKEITADSDFQNGTMRLMITNGQTLGEVVEFVKALDISDAVKVTRLKRATDMYLAKDDAKTVPYYSELMDVKYIDGVQFPSPEEYALKMFDKFGPLDIKSDDFLDIQKSMIKMKVIKGNASYERFLVEYNRLHQKSQKVGK